MTEQDVAFFSLEGVMRFDEKAVASCLRKGELSQRALEMLARLIEGSHQEGLSLQLKGQGKGWTPMFEKAQATDRHMEIGAFVDKRTAEGCTVEDAVFDASEEFDLSEATIRRDLQMYRLYNTD